MDFLGDVVVSLLGSLGSLSVAYLVYKWTRRDQLATAESQRKQAQVELAESERRRVTNELVSAFGTLSTATLGIVSLEWQQSFYAATARFIAEASAAIPYLRTEDREATREFLRYMYSDLEQQYSLALQATVDAEMKKHMEAKATELCKEALRTQAVLVRGLVKGV